MSTRRDNSLEKFSRSQRNKGFGNRKGFFSAAEIKVLPSTCSFCDNNGSGQVVTLSGGKTACDSCFQHIVLSKIVMEAQFGGNLE